MKEKTLVKLIINGEEQSDSLNGSTDLVNSIRNDIYVLVNTLSIFQDNDERTREFIKTNITRYLQVRDDIDSYIIICNSENNTPDVVDSNSIYIDMAIRLKDQFEKESTFISIPIRIRPDSI